MNGDEDKKLTRNKMRHLVIYLMVLLAFIFVVVLVFFKDSEYRLNHYLDSTDDNSFNDQLYQVGVHQVISSQPYYKQLCELDRYELSFYIILFGVTNVKQIYLFL